jgi:hypothetical protein
MLTGGSDLTLQVEFAIIYVVRSSTKSSPLPVAGKKHWFLAWGLLMLAIVVITVVAIPSPKPEVTRREVQQSLAGTWMRRDLLEQPATGTPDAFRLDKLRSLMITAEGMPVPFVQVELTWIDGRTWSGKGSTEMQDGYLQISGNPFGSVGQLTMTRQPDGEVLLQVAGRTFRMEHTL